MKSAKNLNEIYPEDWLKSSVVYVEKNVIELSEHDKDILYMQVGKKGFQEKYSFIKEGNHPFDSVTYFFQLNDNKGKHDVFVNVRNNQQGEFDKVMQFTLPEFNGVVGYAACKSTPNDKMQVLLSPVDKRDMDLISNLCDLTNKLNNYVGVYAISNQTKKVSKRIGKIADHLVESSGDTERRTLKLSDIPGVHISSYIEGNGIKPTHEFGVRGHFRHYKNGKVVFIRPYRKCIGRGENTTQVYSIC